MSHFRVALYDLKSGTADEVAEISKAGLVPIFKRLPGYIRYEVGQVDDGGLVSFSVWMTATEAQHATVVAADWVAENLTSRISLRDEHTGELYWDE
ncbi:MAG: hypothetical protein EXQ81_09940 [Thermoleophilia bacterium]|nr:hypothetical protein [Thermoleophilia bacterium]